MRIPRTACVVAVIALMGPRSLQAQPTVTILDSAGDVGRYVSIAIGGDALPLVSYYDATNGDLKVAHCANAACTGATLSVVDSAGDVGLHGALAIGPDGLGLISYYDATNAFTKVAHCENPNCSTATVTVLEHRDLRGRTAIGVGSDGNALIAYLPYDATAGQSRLHAVHCDNAACTSSTITAFSPPAFSGSSASLTFGKDGLGLIAYPGNSGPPFPSGSLLVARCANVQCSALAGSTPQEAIRVGGSSISDPAITLGHAGLFSASYSWISNAPPPGGTTYGVSLQPEGIWPPQTLSVTSSPPRVSTAARGSDGGAWIAYPFDPDVRLRRCSNSDCTVYEDSCVAQRATQLALARGPDDVPIIGFYDDVTQDLGVARDTWACLPAALSIEDGAVAENGTALSFRVVLSRPVASIVTWDTQILPGSATPGLDFGSAIAVSIAPLALEGFVLVPIVDDPLDEPDEDFSIRVLNPSGGVLLGDAEAVGVILDNDGPATLRIGGCQAIEGSAGTTDCLVDVRLEPVSGQGVTVEFATTDGSAQAGSDYVGTSGTITFAPGTLLQTVSVSVVGDTTVELDETFFVNLSNPVNATIGDGQGEGLIVDDDAPSLSSLELTHGARVAADLAAAPGPLADQDVYRLSQGPYSSWEIVVDDVSGDIAPGLLLERLAEDNSTILQTGASVGTGSARNLRWQRRFALSETRQHIRVQSTSCTTDCGPDDTYRLRAYETTGRVPRFNNSGSQITVLILQNATDQPLQAHADFWDATGSLRATVPISLGPRAAGLVNTSTVPALAGLSGSITVTHDGPYGGLVGKAVALEPSTGFSFDSPMVPKPR